MVIGLFLLATLLAGPVYSAEIFLTPDADTGLIELSPNNNMGGESFFNAGSNMHGNRNRGLIHFSIAPVIPAGSKIQSVQLALNDVQDPTDGPNSSIFDLHRLLKFWGEGTNTSTGPPGRGSPATTNEATWNNRFALASLPWTAPGAAMTNDFSATSSAEQFIVHAGQSPYLFSSVQLTADVQSWVDHPATNFGWLLKTRDETIVSTARRFASREDSNNGPQLDIVFLPAAHIDSPRIRGGQFTFSFFAFAGQSYVVQSAAGLEPTNVWNVLTNVNAQVIDTNAVITDAVSGKRQFYRVSAQ